MGNTHNMKPVENGATSGATMSQSRSQVPRLKLDGIVGSDDDHVAHVPQENQDDIPVFNRLNLRHSNQNDVSIPMGIEIETSKLTTPGTSIASTHKSHNRYIIRYRNEEEKLTHMLHETELKLKMAVEQGQKLRAKCNRCNDELNSLKENANDTDMTEAQWKKKYIDLDKVHRNLKEETDIIKARNRNGRDFLRQQEETIQQLNIELQQERMEKEDFMSNSLLSLQTMGSRRSKKSVSQREIDNKLLSERLMELTERNQRGREYLAKLEAERIQADNQMIMLNQQLQEERYETESLRNRLSRLAGEKLTSNNPDIVHLDDMNRPTKLAERYSELYDTKWTDAFSELTRAHDVTDTDAVKRLLDILITIYSHCRRVASDQVESLQVAIKPYFGDDSAFEEYVYPFVRHRKSNYKDSLSDITETLDADLESLKPSVGPTTCLEAYISEATELCWLLALQDQPCTLDWEATPGEPLDRTLLTFYTRSGTQIEFMVWPPLYLHHNGPLLTKGVAQAMPGNRDRSDTHTPTGDGVPIYAQVQKKHDVAGNEANRSSERDYEYQEESLSFSDSHHYSVADPISNKTAETASGSGRFVGTMVNGYDTKSTGFEIDARDEVNVQHHTYVRDSADATDGYAVVNELNKLHSDHQIIEDGATTVIITSVDNTTPTTTARHSPYVSRRESPPRSKLVIRVGDDDTMNKYNLNLETEECMTRF